MENKVNRWITSLVLLAMFGVIAVAGSRATKAQGTQNVLVTNTSSQQVPVLPAARPSPGGAYIVSVANAPNVKVVSSTSAPVSTKEVNNTDVSSQTAVGAGSILASTGVSSTVVALSVPGAAILDAINVWSDSTTAGEAVDFVEVQVLMGGAIQSDNGFSLQATNHGNISTLSASCRILVPAGDQVKLYMYRFGAVTAPCNTDYNVTYHPVPAP